MVVEAVPVPSFEMPSPSSWFNSCSSRSMRQRSLAVATGFRTLVDAGRLESQYLVGSFSATVGHYYRRRHWDLRADNHRESKCSDVPGTDSIALLTGVSPAYVTILQDTSAGFTPVNKLATITWSAPAAITNPSPLRRGIMPSMSRKGICWDNTCSETLFRSLKVERLHGQHFETRRQGKDEAIDRLL